MHVLPATCLGSRVLHARASKHIWCCGRAGEGAITSKAYCLVPGDLRDVASLQAALEAAGFDRSLPSYVLAVGGCCAQLAAMSFLEGECKRKPWLWWRPRHGVGQSVMARHAADGHMGFLWGAECVLVYMDPGESAALVRWLGGYLSTAEFVTYEQVHAHLRALPSARPSMYAGRQACLARHAESAVHGWK